MSVFLKEDVQYINDDAAPHWELYGWGPRLERPPRQLARLKHSIFISLLSPSAVHFEDGAKNDSVCALADATQCNFMKQVSLTARWVIVVMAKQELSPGAFTSRPIKFCAVQISCQPEKERLECYQVICRPSVFITLRLDCTFVFVCFWGNKLWETKTTAC